jgi:hypothetical protein
MLHNCLDLEVDDLYREGIEENKNLEKMEKIAQKAAMKEQKIL